MDELLRVLVVDDMALYRKLLGDLINEIPGMEVAGSAPNGRLALSKIDLLQPDVITLDVEMPVMDGLETLRLLSKRESPPLVIVVSVHTHEGAEKTLTALDLGAYAFITKPHGSNMEKNRRQLSDELRSILTGLLVKSRIRKACVPAGPPDRGGFPAFEQAGNRVSRPGPTVIDEQELPEIIAIAISTGGPKALGEVIPRLPGNLKVPVVVVQHIPTDFTAALVESLDKKSAVKVRVGQHGMGLEPGTVYFAPGGKQMKVRAPDPAGPPLLQVTDDAAENHCKPSADFLMRSVARTYGSRALGIIMTGMGSDGVLGLRLMKSRGASVIAQDRETSVVFGMPSEAIKAGVVDITAPLHSIADLIVERVQDK